MRDTDVRAFLTAVPFRPIRITLTDGRTHDVYHPEMVMVGRSSIVIGLMPPGMTDPVYDRFVTVGLLHVMQIEALQSVAS